MSNSKIVTINLMEPIEIGKEKVENLSLRRPLSGDLRGLSTAEIMSMKVDTHLKLLTRIAQPILTIDQLDAISPQDLLAIQGKIFSFFMPNGQAPMPTTEAEEA